MLKPPQTVGQATQLDRTKWLALRTVGPYLAIAIACIFSIYAAKQQMAVYGRSVFDIPYGFGPVIRSIVEQHRYGSADPDFGWWSYAHRMPVIPLLGAVSWHVSSKALVFMLLKNVIFWSLWVLAFIRLMRRYDIPTIFMVVTPLWLILAPYDLSIAGRVDVEEGFLFALLALLFSSLLTMESVANGILVGLLVGAIYLTKSSMLLVCLSAAVWALYRHARTRPMVAILPLVGLLTATLVWGSYIKSVSGVFAIGSNASSWNGMNFYKGNNPYAYPRYPRVNLDSIDHDDGKNLLLPTTPVNNEWELNAAQLALGSDYVRMHPRITLRMDLRKLFVACCDLGEAPAKVTGRTRLGVVISSLVNHLLTAGVVALVVWNLCRRQATAAEILSILLSVAVILPYFGGFLYSRHLVPVYGLLGMTLPIQLKRCRWAAVRIRTLGLFRARNALASPHRSV